MFRARLFYFYPRRFLVLALFCLFFSLITPSHNITLASEITGNGATLSLSRVSAGLTFSGTRAYPYHFFLSIQLPVGSIPSDLVFGCAPSRFRSIVEYDFISYVGNTVTIDFFLLSSGDSYSYELRSLSGSIDFRDCLVLSYGVFGVDQGTFPTYPIFIYDHVLALKQYYNTYHYLSGISSNLAISTSTMEVKDTDTHYSLSTGSGSAVTSVTENEYIGLWTTSDLFLQSARLSSDANISTGLGPTVNTYNPLASASLTGGLSSTVSSDLITDEWGQFLDRVTVCSGLTISSPDFPTFVPGDFYFPFSDNGSFTVGFRSGYLFTNGFSPTQFTIILDISGRPSSVSVSGANLDSWSYASQRLTLNCSYASSDPQIALSDISISLSGIRTNFPFLKISAAAVGSCSAPGLVNNLDQHNQENIISRGFSSISSAINGLFSGLTTSYNSLTSDSLAALDSTTDQLSSSTATYVQSETTLTNNANSTISSFSPDTSYFSSFVPAFGLVNYVTSQFFENSGSFKYIITFVLTLSVVLFCLGIRRS